MSSLPVLVLNSGSSSIKFSVYEAGDGQRDQAPRGRGGRHRHRSGQVLDQGRRRQKARRSDPGSAQRAPWPSSWWPTRSTPATSLPRRPSAIAWSAAGRRCRRTSSSRPQLIDEIEQLRRPCAAAHAHRRLHHARGAAALPRHSQLRRASTPTSIAPCPRWSRTCPSPRSIPRWACGATAITASPTSRSSTSCSPTCRRSSSWLTWATARPSPPSATASASTPRWA